MSKSKFRAVLTIFGDFKVLEIRFDGLNEEKTEIKVKPNINNRHVINGKDFITSFLNLTSAINSYADSLKARVVLGKILGMW